MMIQLVLIIIILILNLMMLVAGLIMILRWKSFVKNSLKSFGKQIINKKYGESLAELFTGIGRMKMQTMVENSLRASRKEVLHRPLGPGKIFPNFEPLMFNPAQTTPFPVDKETEVDISVTIGPAAKKPLKLDIPLIISGMGYGIGLSEKAKIALAKAATNAGTAINSGEGGFLPEEREAAKYYILQFGKAPWAKENEEIKQADAIEIKLGQGALAGLGSVIKPEEIKGRAQEILRMNEGEDAIIYETFFDNQTLNDLKQLVAELRKKTGGVPVGAKILAGGKLEEDLDRLIELGVDFVTIDGAQGATHDSPPIMQDDFGIPTVHAVVRAAKHLENRKVKDKISLIVSGGLFTPGDFLKALALGADAVALGTAVLFAVLSEQAMIALPWDPPTTVVWYNGKHADAFDVDKGAETAANYLKNCVEEMKMAIRAMGKTSLKEVTAKDLVSYDETLAKKIGLPFTLDPYESGGQKS